MLSYNDLIIMNFKWRSVISYFIGGVLGLAIFYLHPETNEWFRYPLLFPLVAFVVAITIYTIATFIIKSLNSNERLKRNAAYFTHAVLFFILPLALKGMAYHYISGVWFFPTVTFVLLQLFYGKNRFVRIASILIPVYAYLIHYFIWTSKYHNNPVPLELLFTLFLTIIYYHLASYFFDLFVHKGISEIKASELETFYFKFGLTTREQQIASDIISGYSNKEIASRFAIAEGTVKNHTQSIYKKMRINSRTKLTDLFVRSFFK